MFCPYCGHKISDGAGFCGNCGKKVAVAAQTTPTIKPHQKRWKGIHFSKKVAGGIVATVLTAGIAFSGYTVMDDYFSKEQQVLLVSSERNCEVVTIDSKGNVRKRAVLGTSDDADAAKISNFDDIKYSEDEKYLYYRTCINDTDGGTLYRAELSKLKKDPEKNNRYIKKIGENVTANYEFVQKDSILYTDSAESLYYYNDGQTTFLAKNVTSFRTDGEDRLVYRNEDGVLRSVSLKDPKKHTTIAENAGYMISFPDVDHIVYAADRWQRPSEIYVTGYGQKSSHPNGFSSWDDSQIVYYSPERKVYAFSSNSTELCSLIQFDEQGIATISDQAFYVSAGDLLWYVPKAAYDAANNGNEYYAEVYDCYHEKNYRVKVAAGESLALTTSLKEEIESNVYGGGIIGSGIHMYEYLYGSSQFAISPLKIENGEIFVEDQEDFERGDAEIVGVSENALYYVTNYTDDYVADFYVIEDGVERCIAKQIDVASVRAYEDGTVLYYNENPTFLMRMTPDGTKIAYERELDSCEFMKDGAFLYSTSDGVLYWEKENVKKRIAEGTDITVHGDAIQEPMLDTSRYYF